MSVPRTCDSDTCSSDVRLGRAARTCDSDVQLGRAARMCSSDVQLGCATRTCSSDVQLGRAARMCGSDVRLGHVRLTRASRQAGAGILSPRVRAESGRAARRRGRRREVRRPGRRYRGADRPPAGAEGGGGRIPADRGRQHGERDQVDLGAARLRRHRLHHELLRGSGRPARVPRGRCAGDHPGHDSPVRGCAVRVRHGACGRAGATRSRGRGPARCRRCRGARRVAGHACR